MYDNEEKQFEKFSENTFAKNVDRFNFEETLQEIEQNINKANFISIDTEMTGLSSGLSNNLELYDSMESRYEKIKDSATKFQVLQYGLGLFFFNSLTKRYEVQAYNFYTFQNFHKNLGNEFKSAKNLIEKRHCFLSQAGSISFLSEQNFDFNRCFSRGINFLNKTEVNLVKQEVLGKERCDSPLLIIEEEDVRFVNKATEEISNWLQNSNSKSLQIDAPSSYHRRLLHEQVKLKYNGYCATEGKEGCVIVKKLTKEEKKNSLNNDLKFEVTLRQLIGFSQVIDLVVKSKKPVVGHNLYLDLCHTLHHFLEDLPSNFSEFKILVSKYFPLIFDTKFICTDPAVMEFFSNSNLGEASAAVRKSPFLNPLIESPFGEEGELHDASYDAYITGYLFLKLFGKILKFGLDEDGSREVDYNLEAVKTYNGKLFLMKSDYDCLNLFGEDDIPDRSNVFHLYDSPQKLNYSDLNKKFKNFGKIYFRPEQNQNKIFENGSSCNSVAHEVENKYNCFFKLRDTTKINSFKKSFGLCENGDDTDRLRNDEGELVEFDFKIETYESYLNRSRELSGCGERPKKRKRNLSLVIEDDLISETSETGKNDNCTFV